MTITLVNDIPHTEYLLHNNEASRMYTVRDFLCILKRTQREATIVACDLYRIPSRDAWYHEFLLVHVDMGEGERLMLIVERSPSNENMAVLFLNGGVAKDTITVVRVREDHEYWNGVDPAPICKGTLRWHHSPPRLLDIGLLACATSTTSKYYNFYIRQCFWYARVILAAMGKIFPHCSREGATLFSKKRFAIFGSYKLSHVELIAELHTDYCCLAPAVPAIEATSRLVTPDVLRSLAMCATRQEKYRNRAGVRSLIRWMNCMKTLPRARSS